MMPANNWTAISIALACLLATSCGTGKDKYADLNCDELKEVEAKEQSRANEAARAFESDPSTANEKAMRDAQANAMYAADVLRDKKCSQ